MIFSSGGLPFLFQDLKASPLPIFFGYSFQKDSKSIVYSIVLFLVFMFLCSCLWSSAGAYWTDCLTL